MAERTGVYPCYENQFQIETAKVIDGFSFENLFVNISKYALENTRVYIQIESDEQYINKFLSRKEFLSKIFKYSILCFSSIWLFLRRST